MREKIDGGVAFTKSEQRRLDSLHEETRKQREEFCIEQEKDANKVKIPIAQEINDQLDELYKEDELTELVASLLVKFDSHFALTVDKRGNATLKFHKNPSVQFRGTVRSVVDDALAY